MHTPPRHCGLSARDATAIRSALPWAQVDSGAWIAEVHNLIAVAQQFLKLGRIAFGNTVCHRRAPCNGIAYAGDPYLARPFLGNKVASRAFRMRGNGQNEATRQQN